MCVCHLTILHAFYCPKVHWDMECVGVKWSIFYPFFKSLHNRDVISFGSVWFWTEPFETYEAKEMAPVLSVWLWFLPALKPFRTKPLETVPAFTVWLWVELIIWIDRCFCSSSNQSALLQNPKRLLMSKVSVKCENMLAWPTIFWL